ncbi:DUF397 domain-containing protein [Streptomyces sp. NPDC088116]|uniref:DUF397 domain-containing protein n=1 Tax=Streptomyces sp. NPDC088116 TaxID=3365825 RepID=UPI0037F1D96B
MTTPKSMPVTTLWHKSSYSTDNGGNCIEIASGQAGVIPIRDSKSPDGPRLMILPGAFISFVQAVRQGEFKTS